MISPSGNPYDRICETDLYLLGARVSFRIFNENLRVTDPITPGVEEDIYKPHIRWETFATGFIFDTKSIATARSFPHKLAVDLHTTNFNQATFVDKKPRCMYRGLRGTARKVTRRDTKKGNYLISEC